MVKHVFIKNHMLTDTSALVEVGAPNPNREGSFT